MLRDNNLNWRKEVLEIFEYYTDRTPGSFIENKEINIAWHFGMADSAFGSWQAAECQNHISNTLISSYPIHTLATKKRVEVMPRNVSKATIIKRVLVFRTYLATSSGRRPCPTQVTWIYPVTREYEFPAIFVTSPASCFVFK
jgi:trehalose-phosphatase